MHQVMVSLGRYSSSLCTNLGTIPRLFIINGVVFCTHLPTRVENPLIDILPTSIPVCKTPLPLAVPSSFFWVYWIS
jgi:hypothetical protein